MDNERVLYVTFDETQYAVPVAPAVMTAVEEPVRKKAKTVFPRRITALLLGILLIAGAGFAAVQFGIPALRYFNASSKLEKGDYVAAQAIFTELGGYRNAAALADEAGRGIVYLNAKTLLEQGDREGAQLLLEKVGNFLDAEELLQDIINEITYEQASQDMEKGLYIAAREGFEKLGTYADAAEKAEECRVLHEAKVSQKTYERACRLMAEDDIVGAYREFASIPDRNYKDTAKKLEELMSQFEQMAEQYAQAGERGVVLACIRMVEEVDADRGAALRARLIPAEECVPDQSFYILDTSHVTRIYYGTTKEELAAVVIYMLLHGQMDMALMSNAELDYNVFVDRALQGIDLAGEILPGYGATYNPLTYVGDRYVKYNLTSQQEYSEFERTQNIKRFKAFCEDSVLAMTEAGLLSETMSRRQKAEVIFNWVCFYLTYDQSLHIHDVGIAVRDKKGVCEAFAALYNRMCNLAGVPTYGQIGLGGDGRHIWSFHVDETGEIYYSDSTWGDSYPIDYSVAPEEPTLERFMEYYLERCMQKAMAERSGFPGSNMRPEDVYFWSKTLWYTHKAERTTDEIMAFHVSITGGTKK